MKKITPEEFKKKYGIEPDKRLLEEANKGAIPPKFTKEDLGRKPLKKREESVIII